MRLIIIFATVLLFFSCKKTEKARSDVFMKINNVALYSENILEIEIINNSNKNYFICMDTLSFYENTEFNAKINSLLHPQKVFYSKGDSIKTNPIPLIPYYGSNDTTRFKCIMKTLKAAPLFIKQLKNLKKILILKSKDTISIKVPFKNTYEICNRDFAFFREKGNYDLELNYKMDKKLFYELVEKKLILELEQKNIFPYYEEIISNKVPFIIK